MTHELYERLLHNGASVPEYFANARKIWDAIWAKVGDSATASDLAVLLPSAQMDFEMKCGGRYLGQEIMAITAIAQFYSCDVGFEGTIDKARTTRDAIKISGCSVEVISMVNRIADGYAIDERPPSGPR